MLIKQSRTEPSTAGYSYKHIKVHKRGLLAVLCNLNGKKGTRAHTRTCTKLLPPIRWLSPGPSRCRATATTTAPPCRTVVKAKHNKQRKVLFIEENQRWIPSMHVPHGLPQRKRTFLKSQYCNNPCLQVYQAEETPEHLETLRPNRNFPFHFVGSGSSKIAFLLRKLLNLWNVSFLCLSVVMKHWRAEREWCHHLFSKMIYFGAHLSLL